LELAEQSDNKVRTIMERQREEKGKERKDGQLGGHEEWGTVTSGWDFFSYEMGKQQPPKPR